KQRTPGGRAEASGSEGEPRAPAAARATRPRGRTRSMTYTLLGDRAGAARPAVARGIGERAADGGATARLTDQLDLAAGGAACRADSAEADAAARELGDLAAGRQAVVEQGLDEVAAGVVREAAMLGGGADGVPVDAGTVVADLDDEGVADV